MNAAIVLLREILADLEEGSTDPTWPERIRSVLAEHCSGVDARQRFLRGEVQWPPTEAQVQSVLDAAKATGMPLTALRWAIHRLNESLERRHASGCFNDQSSAKMCQVCGGDL